MGSKSIVARQSCNERSLQAFVQRILVLQIYSTRPNSHGRICHFSATWPCGLPNLLATIKYRKQMISAFISICMHLHQETVRWLQPIIPRDPKRFRSREIPFKPPTHQLASPVSETQLLLARGEGTSLGEDKRWFKMVAPCDLTRRSACLKAVSLL